MRMKFSVLLNPSLLSTGSPREIYFALSEVGQCLTALEDMLPENPGHLKGDSAVRIRVEPILSLDAEDEVEAEDTPL